MSEVDPARLKARLAIVAEHVKCENRHDLAGLMATFGAEARYDDEPWQDHRLGLEAVRSYYTELLASLLRQAVAKPQAVRREIALGAVVGLMGQRKAPAPEAWPAFLASFDKPAADVQEALRTLGVVFGDGRALDEVRRLALDDLALLD